MIRRFCLCLSASFLLYACGDDVLNRAQEKENFGPSRSYVLDVGTSEDASSSVGSDVSGGAYQDAYIDAPGPDSAMDASFSDASTFEDAMAVTDAGQPVRECYTETFDPTANITDLERDYASRRRSALSTIMEALRRRYPAGNDLLVAEQNDPYTGSFIDRSSFGTVMESAMTEVHEATHGWDYGHSLFRVHFDYWLRADLQHSLSFNYDGVPRSEIYGLLEDNSTSLYSRTYLTGDQGTRGFLELLDETNCYINGLGAIAAIGDYVPYGISGRDGAVAFLYYVQLYLRRIRTTDSQLYARMQGDADLVEHIKIQWLRAHFFLMFADQESNLGIHDMDIRANLYAVHNMAEISMFIGRCVEASNCLCN